MSELTMDSLKAIMLRCSGVEEGVDLGGDIAGQEFRDLGYDSLAVLEMTSQIQREYQLEIPDEAIEELNSPGDVLRYVNDRLTPAA
ncbi:acyl carrier protein [Salinispora oceanensis]|uniref:acyl carrier protein n=1 Tax=Salinispora oceanensis TaxID=1050199 RepID=UPI000381D795|nr:phosphopantetheine-binding protein [Salinispora oceanensis]